MSRQAVLLRGYRCALRLYPASFRSQFGDEMQEVFEASARDAATSGGLSLTRFLLRELAGLGAGAARERTSPASLGAAARRRGPSCLAGLVAGGVFLLGAVFAGGAFVIHPALYAAMAAVLAIGSFAVGLSCASARSLRGLGGIALLLFLVLAAVPAARVADRAWLGRLAREGGSVSATLPGIHAEARTVITHPGGGVPWDAILPADRRGHLRSGSFPGAAGTRLITVWHRLSSAPPYELMVLLMASALAVVGHAVRDRRTGLARP